MRSAAGALAYPPISIVTPVAAGKSGPKPTIRRRTHRHPLLYPILPNIPSPLLLLPLPPPPPPPPQVMVLVPTTHLRRNLLTDRGDISLPWGLSTTKPITEPALMANTTLPGNFTGDGEKAPLPNHGFLPALSISTSTPSQDPSPPHSRRSFRVRLRNGTVTRTPRCRHIILPVGPVVW